MLWCGVVRCGAVWRANVAVIELDGSSMATDRGVVPPEVASYGIARLMHVCACLSILHIFTLRMQQGID